MHDERLQLRAPVATHRRASRLHAAKPADEHGQAAVEFALVVPFVCLLVWALVEFGIALNYFLDANHLANEGARLAAVVGNTDPAGNFKTTIKQQAPSGLKNGTGSVTAPAQVCVSFPLGGTPKIGDPVKVTVSAPYKWIPFIGGSTTTISGSATMRLEQLPTYAAGCS